jgi:hypothetical protein
MAADDRRFSSRSTHDLLIATSPAATAIEHQPGLRIVHARP